MYNYDFPSNLHPNGVGNQFFLKSSSIKKDILKILFVGRYEKRKGAELLIKANKFNQVVKNPRYLNVSHEFYFEILKNLNILPHSKSFNFKSSKEIRNKKIEFNIDNFYMTDSISRSSITMAKCTKEISNKAA